MSSLSIIKSIKQNAKNDNDLEIINNLLHQNEGQYFPDKELFCLEHLISRINNNNNDNKKLVNNPLLYEIFYSIYESNQNFNKNFITILKNIKLNNLLLNIDFTNKNLVKVLNEKFLDLIIKSNIFFQELNSEKFIIKLLTSYIESKDNEDDEVENIFINNLLKLIQLNKFISNNAIIFKLISLKNTQVNQLIINELFNDKVFKLIPFIENLNTEGVEDEILLNMFELISIGYLHNVNKFDKDILDLAMNKFIEDGNDKAYIFVKSLDTINNSFELKKLNNLPKLETLQKWLDNEFIDKLNDDEKIANVFIKCLNNNIEIGYKYKEQMLKLLEKLDDSELCEALLDCFIDFKEFDSLIKYIVDNDLEYMSKYDTLISDRVHNLTSYQLYELLSNDCKFLENSIIKGMVNVNTITFIQNNEQLQKWLKTIIFGQDSFQNLESLYYLLDLYSKSIIPNITSDNDIKESYKQELNKLIEIQMKNFDYKNIYSYFCIFKTYELSIEYETSKIEIKNIISKFVQNFGNKLNESLLLLKNFTTIINNNIDGKNLETLFNNLFFKNLDNLKYLIDDLLYKNGIENGDIWEEDAIITEITKQLTNIVKKNSENEKLHISIHKLLEIIPIELFNKFDKNSILEKLYTSVNVDDLLIKFLSSPTFKTSLELQENFVSLLNNGNMVLFNKIWMNYLVNINDESCFNYLNKSLKELADSLTKFNNELMPFLVFIIKVSKGYGKIETLINNLFAKLLKVLKADKAKSILTYCDYIYQLYEISNDNKILNNSIIELIETQSMELTDYELQYNLYVAYCIINKKDYYSILPIYLKLRKESKAQNITSGLALYVTNIINDDSSNLSILLTDLISDFKSVYNPYLLELINFILPKLSKNSDEDTYVKLFALLLNNLIRDASVVNLLFLQNLSNIVITKNWLLKQYNIELIVPFLIQTINANEANEDIVLESLKIVSNIINYQQFKLVRRTHLVNSFIVFVMEYLINLTSYDAENVIKSLNRLIANYIDPVNISSSSNNNFSTNFKSNALAYKQELRKYIYPVMLKYINILCDIKVSNSNNLKLVNNFRNGLKLSMYGIFDLLIKENMNLLYNLLDYNGKLYFKKMYKDYEAEGKWKED